MLCACCAACCACSARYEITGPARAVVTGLRLLARDEAGTRLGQASPQLELKVAGKAVTGAEHAAWLEDGSLPPEKLRFPEKVGEPNDLMLEVRWPADDGGPEVTRTASLTLRAEAGEPR